MKIKLLVSMAGADFTYQFGEEITLDDATAQRLIETGQAEKAATVKKKRGVKNAG